MCTLLETIAHTIWDHTLSFAVSSEVRLADRELTLTRGEDADIRVWAHTNSQNRQNDKMRALSTFCNINCKDPIFRKFSNYENEL
jgi:hypothetical protein